jgi:hypothetical protein
VLEYNTGITAATLFLIYGGHNMPLATTIDAGAHVLSCFTAGFNANELSAIDSLVANFMKRYGVPGMSIAMTREGRLVYVKGFGLPDA